MIRLEKNTATCGALRDFEKEGFALAESENETLGGWRKDHREFFKPNGGFHSEMMLVCERFRLVEVHNKLYSVNHNVDALNQE